VNNFAQIIRNIRLRLGEGPRTFKASEAKYFKLKPPEWCRSGKDELHAIYRDFDLLMKSGTAVWGALVQANTLLFSSGPHDGPGDIVYCPQPHWHDDLHRLSDIAKRVSSLKSGSGTTLEEKKIGDWLANERVRTMGHPVPKTIVGETPVLTGVTMFIRKHLPNGMLSNSYFPLLVHPDTKTVIVVPARYWDSELVDIWNRTD
jgi:hypothetical protein